MTHTVGPARLSTTARDVYSVLARLEEPVHIVADGGGVAFTNDSAAAARPLVTLGPLPPGRLGSREFLRGHGVTHCYHAGAMANGIASADLVVGLARLGMLASFGAAGLSPERLDSGLTEIARRSPGAPFACNVIHSPSEPAMERTAVDLCLRHRVRCVEASAFVRLTDELVRYRAAGLGSDGEGRTVIDNRVIAKVSRREIAELFLAPAPAPILRGLVERGAITAEQARLAATVPMADDITAEADSGGHTDRRPLTALLGDLIALRDGTPAHGGVRVRIGAAGGIGTPEAAAAAFTLGADYVVTGSINQACVEAGQSPAVKALLGTAELTDCELAPSADMFELGAKVQVLRRGTMFAGRAAQLYDLYRRYDGIDDIPASTRATLERDVFRRGLDEIWSQTHTYFAERDPDQLARAEGDPKRRMALIFRWYLGLSSRWAVTGDTDRAADYQIWCGPAMGACNTWLRGTHLEAVDRRTVGELATHIMRGAAFGQRVAMLRCYGISLPPRAARYRPLPASARVGARGLE